MVSRGRSLRVRDACRRPISRRQRQVLQLLLTGSRNEEIAASLGVGVETVKTYVAQLLGALDARDRGELAARAFARARAIAKVLADLIDQPLVVSDESGWIWLMNLTAARLGLAAESLPTDVRREISLRHRRAGIIAIRGTFQSSSSGRLHHWIIEHVWIDGSTAMLLWRVVPTTK